MTLYEIGFKSGAKVRLECNENIVNELFSGSIENPHATVQVWGYDGTKGGASLAIVVSELAYVLPVSALR